MKTNKWYVIVQQDGVLWIDGVRKRNPNSKIVKAIKTKQDTCGYLELTAKGQYAYYPKTDA